MFYKTENGCRFGEKCSYAHRQIDEQPSKRSKKNGAKSAVAMLKETKNLCCVFQDVEPPKSSSILRKSSTMRKPIRGVRCTGATLRDARVPDQNPSLDKICPGEHHQRNPNAPKFEDRSQEETKWQEHWAREAAWRLAKKNLKIKGEKEHSILLAYGKVVSPFTILNETGGKRICGGLRASMYMISRKDLNSADLETVKVSRIPITVVTANGEVQTHEEATVYLKELDRFLTVKKPQEYASSVVARKALRGSRIFT